MASLQRPCLALEFVIQQQLRLKKLLSLIPCRCASTAQRKLIQREDRKERIVQYVGDNARRAKRVYVWGLATTGALGIKSYLVPEKRQRLVVEMHYPAYLRFLPQHEMEAYLVACGYGFTVLGVDRRKTHLLLGTGINTSSQLGYHESPPKSGRILDYIIEPSVISLPLNKPQTTKVILAACGRAHTVLVTDTEGVFTLGHNAYGQCGRAIVELEEYRANKAVNQIEDAPKEISQVVCGQDHTLFVTKLGEVYSCGMGTDGQTGLGHYSPTSKISKVKGDIDGEKIVHLSCRGDTVLALSERGDLFGWGNSEYRQFRSVSDSTQVSVPIHLPFRHCGRIISTAAGGSACAVLNDRGQVYVWGYGLLGQGPEVNELETPSLLPEPLFGCNEINPETRVVDIQAGLFHFAAVTNNGGLYTWGKNKAGCLGHGRSQDQTFPLKVQLPAEAYRVHCGVDHMVVMTRSFC